VINRESTNLALGFLVLPDPAAKLLVEPYDLAGVTDIVGFHVSFAAANSTGNPTYFSGHD